MRKLGGRKLAALAILVVLGQNGASQAALGIVNRIRARILVEPVGKSTSAQLAGRYTSESEELRKRTGNFLDGDDLYLFPDGTYVYCEWGDNEPLTVYDKGAWTFSGGTIELRSDHEITWEPKTERRFVVVHRNSRSDEVLLVGTERGISEFEELSHADPTFALLTAGKLRVRAFDPASAKRVKAQLMQESWRPEHFRQDQP